MAHSKVEGVPAHWHSRRHETAEASNEARERYGLSQGRLRRQQSAKARQHARANRTNEEQMALIENRPGSSTRERLRISLDVVKLSNRSSIG